VKDVGIFNGNFVYFTDNCHLVILWSLGIFFLVLVCCKKSGNPVSSCMFVEGVKVSEITQQRRR
jgi:hypothetical protein